MEKHKTDESVKTGLQTAADTELKTSTGSNNAADEAKEVDADEAIHEQETLPVVSGEEQDADELVHSIPDSESVIDNTNEIDPDDLVHKKDDLLPDQ